MGELDRRNLTEQHIAAESATKACQYVQNDKTAVMHAVALAGPLIPPLDWATRCGWKFASKPHSLVSEMPADVPWRSIRDR